MSWTLGKIILLLVLVVAGGFGVHYYLEQSALNRKLAKLEEEKRELAQVVERLSAEKRVAEVMVTEQKPVNGVLQTTLLFVEYAKDQTPLPPKSFTIEGKMAHIDAMVIKFERDFVGKNDLLRGHSIALFTRLFGEKQAPEKGFVIDEPGKIPDVYRGATVRSSEFEEELWKNFWKLAEDKAYRQEKGVRVANGQSVWTPFEMDRLYTLSIESSGGVNISSEPIKGIYREALRRRTAGNDLK